MAPKSVRYRFRRIPKLPGLHRDVLRFTCSSLCIPIRHLCSGTIQCVRARHYVSVRVLTGCSVAYRELVADMLSACTVFPVVWKRRSIPGISCETPYITLGENRMLQVPLFFSMHKQKTNTSILRTLFYSPQYQQYVQYQHEPTVERKMEEMPRRTVNLNANDPTSSGYQENPPVITPLPSKLIWVGLSRETGRNWSFADLPSAAAAVQRAPAKPPARSEKSNLLHDDDVQRLQ